MTEQQTPPMYHALLAAVKQDSATALRELLAGGADVNLRSKLGNSLLHIAVKYKSHNAAVWLMRHGADIDAVDNEGCSALDCAMRKLFGTAVTVMALLGHGARVDTIADTSKMHRRFAPLLGVLQVDCPVPRAANIQRHGLERYDELCVEAANVLGKSRYNVVRWRMLEICAALQNLRLPALVTVFILEHSFLYGDMIPMYRKWALITIVKHWRERQLLLAEAAAALREQEIDN